MAKNNLTTHKSVRVEIAKAKIAAWQAIIVALITAIAAAIPVYFAGRQHGQENSPAKSETHKAFYQDEIRTKENQIIEKQNQIQSLRKTIDFLMGKTGMLNEKNNEYEHLLKIPQDGRIILFEHINYKGHGCYLKPGDDVPDLSLYGFGNSVSSIKVEGALRAKAYSEVNYAGFLFPSIESDVPSLVDHDWNDKILSISVEKK